MPNHNPEITISSDSEIDIFSLINFEEMVINVLDQIFQEMISLPLEHVPDFTKVEGPFIASEIDFLGTITGKIHVHIPQEFARVIAAAMCQMDAADLDQELIADTVGEVTNMISGNLKTDLCNTGLDCRLKVPKVTHASTLPAFLAKEGIPLAFKNGEHLLNITICLAKGELV